MRGRYSDTLAVQHFTRQATPGAMYDIDGQTLAQLGVSDTAHYLIRPDGHIGYRAAGTHLDGLGRYSRAGSRTPHQLQPEQPTRRTASRQLPGADHPSTDQAPTQAAAYNG
jgi:hypothetical protein